MHESEDSCKITGGRHLGIRSLSSIDNDMITQQDLAFTGEELRAMQDTTADSTTLKDRVSVRENYPHQGNYRLVGLREGRSGFYWPGLSMYLPRCCLRGSCSVHDSASRRSASRVITRQPTDNPEIDFGGQARDSRNRGDLQSHRASAGVLLLTEESSCASDSGSQRRPRVVECYAKVTDPVDKFAIGGKFAPGNASPTGKTFVLKSNFESSPKEFLLLKSGGEVSPLVSKLTERRSATHFPLKKYTEISTANTILAVKGEEVEPGWTVLSAKDAELKTTIAPPSQNPAKAMTEKISAFFDGQKDKQTNTDLRLSNQKRIRKSESADIDEIFKPSSVDPSPTAMKKLLSVKLVHTDTKGRSSPVARCHQEEKDMLKNGGLSSKPDKYRASTACRTPKPEISKVTAQCVSLKAEKSGSLSTSRLSKVEASRSGQIESPTKVDVVGKVVDTTTDTELRVLAGHANGTPTVKMTDFAPIKTEVTKGYLQPSRFADVDLKVLHKLRHQETVLLSNLLRVLNRPQSSDVKSVSMVWRNLSKKTIVKGSSYAFKLLVLRHLVWKYH
ncbi:uncharacterized protein LOC111250171 isoform X2 [Varroa destructor]|uniref:Uncharacterized protein n=1 Tax=Varroa destructor TaxID=109461 RepID=A0A7M7K331_VARDE|nr:uncharacterized protein LOC111250171 isoform X2 [Varroa destructor]